MKTDLGASVRARLLNIAKAQGEDFNYVLVRFALERLLYRLGQSAYAERFLLKGALLFSLWYDMPHRPTRDADLLEFGASDIESIAGTFREIANIQVEDGIVFDADSVTVDEMRKEAGYPGARVPEPDRSVALSAKPGRWRERIPAIHPSAGNQCQYWLSSLPAKS